MKKLKERIPLKYIYVLSTIIAILLSVGLYYTYAMFTANVSFFNSFIIIPLFLLNSKKTN